MRRLLRYDDGLWGTFWIAGMGVLLAWDLAFLNAPAFARLVEALANTLFGATLAVLFTLLFGWAAGVGGYLFEQHKRRLPSLALSYFMNLIRSIPQMIGILGGYIVLTILIEREILQSQLVQLLWMSFTISVFTFPELADVIRERIEYYRRSDFFDAMLCSGVRESRIINFDILWKNSIAHIAQKLVSTFAMAIFLQCSIDFIISVGLSTDVSLTNFPVTLGGMLATMDSKQDILAISMLFEEIGYWPNLLFRHLQGVSAAFSLVFTLVCMYRVSNGLIRRHNL
jgi:ABC-type dipeptide/oligopeptide/nickel transport system permease subunit